MLSRLNLLYTSFVSNTGTSTRDRYSQLGFDSPGSMVLACEISLLKRAYYNSHATTNCVIYYYNIMLFCCANIYLTFMSVCYVTQPYCSVMSQCDGLLIMDEVQVGFGRMGDHWWAFQQYGSGKRLSIYVRNNRGQVGDS